ncbi:hypothetical protein [Roseibacillus ishigakijimensis]|uniref:hypothetical protein n=1 Tax=Roseibacillus ishigakijimensis TaxID=454146 RepID=UPI0019067B0D|nr:hypothetical protein [Roseibacillus ishigakijimensis]
MNNASGLKPSPNEKAKATEILTKKELAQRLRVSERKIEMSKDIPSIRWGRSVRYDWNDVLAYLKQKGGSAQ